MQVSRWGKSLAVRLPKKLVEALKLRAGDDVVLVAAGEGVIAIEKADARSTFLAEAEQIRFTLPESYRFDRAEANAR